MPPAGWALAALAIGTIVAIAYWLLVSTEGVYLGPRVVTLLYDRYASRYDQVKEFDEQYERHFVGEPVARFLAERTEELPQPVWMLDVASGTGRFARTVMPADGGRPGAVCLDSSRPMLLQARRNLHGIAGDGQAVYMQHAAGSLPFADNAFPVVACLEALEFMPEPQVAITELVRVARPGGLLVMTNRIGWQARLFPGRRFSRQQLADLLRSNGCSYVSITPWQVDYDRVLAVKDGGLVGPSPLEWRSMVRCVRCGGTVWAAQAAALHCETCGAMVQQIDDIWQFTAPVEVEKG